MVDWVIPWMFTDEGSRVGVWRSRMRRRRAVVERIWRMRRRVGEVAQCGGSAEREETLRGLVESAIVDVGRLKKESIYSGLMLI